MRARDKAICSYVVSECEQYGLIDALVLQQIRCCFRSFGEQFEGKKFYRTVQQIANDMGLPYATVRKHLPTEEMGIRHYSGYKPGTLIKTSWWEDTSFDQNKKTEKPTVGTSEEKPTAGNSILKKENKKKIAIDCSLRNNQGVSSSLREDCEQEENNSSVVHKEPEGLNPPDFSGVVDLRAFKKKNKITAKEVEYLIGVAGKKDKITSVLIHQVRKQSDKFGFDTLVDCARKVKFHKFYATLSLQSLLSDAIIQNILNIDNEVKDDNDKGWSGIRVEVEPQHFVPVDIVDKQFPYFEFTADTEYIETIKETSPEGYVKFKELRFKLDPETGERYEERIVENPGIQI